MRSNEMCPFMSDFTLSSQREKSKCVNTWKTYNSNWLCSVKLGFRTAEWFRYSPILHGTIDSIHTPKYYVHRAESTQAWFYILPEGTISPSTLFVFTNTAMLEQFYNEVQSSTTEITVQPLAEVLGSQIIQDTAKFLTELAHKTYKAVGFHIFGAEPLRYCQI